MSIREDERYYLKLKALYYLYTKGLTQTEIAKMLNISRVTLGKLLEEARAEGMVRVEIVDVRNMLSLLEKCGYRRASLAVQKENYAAKMYQKLGFEIVNENESEYIMVKRLR